GSALLASLNSIGNDIIYRQFPFWLRKPQKLPVAFPQIHEQAKRYEPHLLHVQGEVGHAVIQKPGKQFFIAYPAAVFFPSGSLSTFRLVPRYIASMMASL